LALVLLLDQMSRNLNRGTPGMFAHDAQALLLARRAIAEGDADVLPAAEMRWHVMPFMHSEDLMISAGVWSCAASLVLMIRCPMQSSITTSSSDLDGFPTATALLGRAMRADEQEFLDKGGFAG
jgi:uncharacterized protein (DUF924 family)